MTVFRTIIKEYKFHPYPEEGETYFFEDINKLISKMKKNPEEYTETTVLIIKEYLKKIYQKS